ncbi:hypothetical protein [Sphingomonas mesophila]|uniref:hypothetical protein n=1 Tax=Sphingomonas mesophila TaxID=2303576 RepID=UPI000E58EE44|nr:hypothetical protein [Sphingomonas mesophila]
MNMQSNLTLSSDDSISALRDLLQTTLAIVDELKLPGDIGAHLDLVICRVDALLPAPRED